MTRFEITDDSGFLGLVDPDAYAGYVPDWDFDLLIAHFTAAIAERSLLFWGTGDHGGSWKVDVLTDGRPSPPGFRRVTGPIRVTSGRLHLTNYESLTMVAQFADQVLPQDHMDDLVVELPPGDYVCEIVQVADPEEGDAEIPGFVITLTPGEGPPVWPEPAWLDKEMLGLI